MMAGSGKWVGIYRGKWLAHFNQQNSSHTFWKYYHWANTTFSTPKKAFLEFVHLRKSSTQAARTRTAVQLRQPSMSAMSGRTTASSKVSTQVAAHPHEYQEDILSLIEKHVTRSGKKYSDILIEKYVSWCLTRNHGAIPQTVTRSPRIQSHTASANRFLIENEPESRLRMSSFSSAKRSGWRRWPVKGKYFQVLRKEFGS